MRTLQEYLTESAKKYDFRIKLAHDVSPEHEAKLRTMLERFSVADFKKIGKTPVQDFPLDFPKLRNREVTVFEVSLDYPTTQFELTEYVSQGLEIAKEGIVVRRPGEPLEEYQRPTEKREGALLTDPDYKEAGNAKFEDYYGEKYNASFLKSLNDDAKKRREERGEVIPSTVEGKDLNSIPQNNTSPIKQTDYDPRKK